MLKLFSSEDRFMVWHIKELLDQKGIPCCIKNEFAIGAAGDLSPFDCWPEVWITDEEWMIQAQAILLNIQQQGQGQSDWICPQCSEINTSSFDICWQCQHQRPE